MRNKVERLYFMDSMRAILMMLGVVLHSSQVFNSSQSWLIYSDRNSDLMAWLIGFISTFRMPAFFVVSGYFCYLTLNKYKVKYFLKVRVKRIVVPFICSALILNTFQALFLNTYGWQSYELSSYIQNGQYVSHLWFLTNIIVYFLFACIMTTIVSHSLSENIKKSIGYLFDKVPLIIIIFLMPVISIFILSLNKIGFPLYSNFFGLFDVFSILEYSPFFLFGFAVAAHKGMLSKYCTINPIICFSVAVVLFSVTNLTSGLDGNVFKVITEYCKTLTQWLLVSVCFYIFYKFFNQKSKYSLVLSDSSYTVYLFHHFFVIMLGTLLIYLEVPAIFGSIILILVVAGITLGIHNYIVARNKVLLFMFNGK